MKPRVFDCFVFGGTPVEMLLLECRLTELYDAVDGFVLVESSFNHQGDRKPLNFRDQADRFAAWKDKLVAVTWDEGMLPRGHEDMWIWANEHAQREGIGLGLQDFDIQPDDIIMQSDADELASPLMARNIRPQRFEKISLHQRGHFWAVDWQYPDPPGWSGTVITRYATLLEAAKQTKEPYTWMRESRIRNAKQLPDGWHFSWLGDREDRYRKVKSFCHPEVVEDIDRDPDWFWREGYHFGLQPHEFIKLAPVDVGPSWPKWMQNPDNVPVSWYRPR